VGIFDFDERKRNGSEWSNGKEKGKNSHNGETHGPAKQIVA